MDGHWLGALAGGSEMGRAVRDHDWAGSPLGPPEQWPEGLRAAVSMCLSTRFPAWVMWGPDLITIYNDGYRPILGDKHASALGAPARDVWPELWDDIGPLLESVLRTGEPTWEQDRQLVVERYGFPEACNFTFSYSPIFDGDKVGGVLDLVYETTAQVVDKRRLECLSGLNSALAMAEQVTHTCLATARALSEHRADVRFAQVYLRAGDDIVLVSSTGRDDVSAERVDLHAVIAGTPVVLGGSDGGRPAAVAAFPLGGTFRGLEGAIVVGLSPVRPFDRAYRSFVEAVADAVSSALDGAYRRSVEIGEYRRISDTLQAAMLPAAHDLPTIAARYLPAVGSLAVGGDWYDVIDLDEDHRALVVGDCVGHGLDAATAMAQLRSAARAKLLEGGSPAAVLNGLDVFASQVDGAMSATVVCAIFDRPARRLTFARAGHPPPLVVGPAGARWLDQAGGPPLAIEPLRDRAEVTIEVTDDDVIILYSDGLIERRGEDLAIGMERLAGAAERLHTLSARTIADALLRETQAEQEGDDVVLVVKRISTPPT